MPRTVLVPLPDRDFDVTEVVGMSSSLAALEMQRVVAEPEDAPDLTVYGLREPRIEVAVTTTTGIDARLLIGEQTPTGDNLYATIAGSNRVALLPTTTCKSCWTMVSERFIVPMVQPGD